ncbi:1829_t:CDS:2 [Funneliformis mosseae]|uniref:1829_t:CDS:1 n=1 Tax=Funneliformis mosseae TaxID=27381 RepID=A0A9N9BSP2_FUNMO|nr:1829_t:CDS:2 [Funneliformis mosseae]
MNNSIIAVDILPNNDGKLVMYGAPNKDITHSVSGKLRIILSKPLKTKLISIKLKGKSEYSDWENQYSCMNIVKLDKVLREKSTLPSGVTDLDYEFNINGNIPQTYVTSFGLIRYKLVAIVQPSSLLAKQSRVERSINIARHYLPCRRELLPAPPTKVYRGQRKDILKYELDVPTIICVNDNSLLIRLRLLPLCDQGKVRKVTFDLIQSEKYRIQPSPQDLQEFSIDPNQLIGNVQLSSSSMAKRKRSHPIHPTSLNISYDEDTWDNPLTYNLPIEQHNSRHNNNNDAKRSKLKATIKSPLMRVRHKLKITMSFESRAEKTLELGFPIIVTTIPDDDTANRLFMFSNNDLPTYDDVINHINDTLPQEEVVSRPMTPESHSQNHSRSSTRPTTPNLYEDGSGDSRSVTPTPSPLTPDYFTINSNTNVSSPFPTSVSDQHLPLHPPLHKKKSQRSLAQAIGRLFLRSESSSRPTSPSQSVSTTPTLTPNLSPTLSSYPAIPSLPNNYRSKTPPQLDLASQNFAFSSSSVDTSPSLYQRSSVRRSRTLATSTSLRSGLSDVNNSRTNHLYARTNSPIWHLNMPDEDDVPAITPEIHSAPSSPRESLIPNVPESSTSKNLLPPTLDHQRRNRRRAHRRSASFDSSLAKNENQIVYGPTTPTRSNTDNSSISTLLRHPSLSNLKGVVKRRLQKKPSSDDNNASSLGLNEIDINIIIPSPTLEFYNNS